MNEFVNTLNKSKATSIISTFTFLNYNKVPAWCDVACWGREGKIYVLFIEVDNNPGVSITNGSEELITQFYDTQLIHYRREDCYFYETHDLSLKDLETLDVWDENLVHIDITIPTWDNNKVRSVIWRPLINNKKRIISKAIDTYEDKISS